MLKNSGVGYSGLNTARSSLSSFVTIEGYEAGKHPLVCKYMRGVFNENPSFPNYWFNLGCEESYLGKAWIEIWKGLSAKTATLLSTLCGQGAREIITVFDIRSITLEENYIVIIIGDALKTTSKKHHTG